MSPLPRDGNDPDHNDARDDDALLGSDNDIEEASKLVRGEPGIWVWLLVVSAGISGLLFGYDTAIISSALLQLANPPEPSPIPALTVAQQSLVTSITSVSALISSLCSGPISEYGRKKAIFAAAVVFILGAVWQSWAQSVQGLVIGRFIVGLGVGAGSAVVPMYITELSPAHLRSRLNTLNTVFITLGQIVAYLIGYWYSRTPFGWRPMFLLGGVPAAVQIGLLFFLPESPRWLVQHGYVENATSVLARVYGIDQEQSNVADRRMLSHLVRSIERGVRNETELASTSAKWKNLFGKRSNRRALLISGGLQGFQQLCGFNALMYFSSLIYAMLDFKNPTLTSLSVAATNFTFTLVSLSRHTDSITYRRSKYPQLRKRFRPPMPTQQARPRFMHMSFCSRRRFMLHPMHQALEMCRGSRQSSSQCRFGLWELPSRRHVIGAVTSLSGRHS
ncbi:hypothetical protein TWF569_005381 [Orbilia oligospora]|nr:hypothetical protein TWF594_001772 [Orbilia oligospora]KAF3148647.1 hypothetical protein TWF569_005381 [Orbilia oligospora]